MQNHFMPSMRNIPDLLISDDPYVKFIIDSRDHANIIYREASNCTFSNSDYEIYPYGIKRLAGLNSSSAYSTLDLDYPVTLPRTGLYRVEILLLRGPDHTGNVWVHDGSTQIGKGISCFLNWQCLNWFKFNTRRFTSGDHTLKVRVTKGAYVGAIKIVPITRHEGDSDGSQESENSLDVISANWTRNSVNEVNPGTIQLAFREEYFQDDHNYSPFVFSFKDSITILAGSNRHETQPVYGGYLTHWNKSGGVLQWNLLDRMMDTQAAILYSNYSIGAPLDGGVSYVQLSNVYETIRYMVETCLHRLNSNGVPRENGFRVDFADISEYNNVTVTGWNKSRNLSQGNPAPSLKLVRGSTGAAEALLWKDPASPYDAATYPILNMDYKSPDDASAMNFDIRLTMHRAGEDLDDALDYYINFNGPGSHTYTLATATPLFNGNWNYLSLNLATVFGNIAPSTAYLISEVALEGTVSSTSPAGETYLDNIMSYKEISEAPRHSNTEVRSVFENLQDLGEKTQHAIYIQPGLERCDDVLIVQPYQNTTLPVAISDEMNLVEVVDYGSTPLEAEFQNQAKTSFNINDDTVGSSYAENLDSMIHYEEYQRHLFDSDLNNQAEVDSATRKRILESSTPSEYLTCKIIGSPYLEPNQNMYYNITEHRAIGVGMAKTIEYDYDPDSSPKLTSTVGVNRPSKLYDHLLFKLYRNVHTMNLRNTGSGYDIFRTHI